ncbi:hypothetical protein AGMMS50268_15750 [Spirochaetia bacterium]|nr:hypothetical protein AGMMS50268_15750 [Spirochaetia bacterium]
MENLALLSSYSMEYLKLKFRQKYLSENKDFLIDGINVHENDI